jgi:hypothetical protein
VRLIGLPSTLFLLFVSAQSALPADVDCGQLAPGDCGFGTYALDVKGGVNTLLSETAPDWSGRLNATVYLSKNVYTYVYGFSLDADSVAQVSAIRLSFIGSSGAVNPFDRSLDFGVLTNTAWTSAGVDDCGDTNGTGCPAPVGGAANKTGFDFLVSSLIVSPSNLLANGKNNVLFGFYAQSKNGPITDVEASRLSVSAINGKNSNIALDTTIVPTVPEPATLPAALAMLAIIGVGVRSRERRGPKASPEQSLT